MSVESTLDGIGLIGTSTGAEIYDVGLINANVKGPSTRVGILLGFGKGTKVVRCFSTGEVSNTLPKNANNSWTWSATGGLVGYLQPNPGLSIILDSFSHARVKGATDYTGGLIGVLEAGGSNKVERSFSTGEVSMNIEGRNGGLTTYTWSEIHDSFSTSIAQKGLCHGVFPSTSLTNSYFTQATSGTACGTYEPGGAEYFKGAVYSEGKHPFQSWDFSLIWEEVDGNYPRLKGFNYPTTSALASAQGENDSSVSISAINNGSFAGYWKVAGYCDNDNSLVKITYTSSNGGKGSAFLPCVDGNWIYNEMYGTSITQVTAEHGSASATLLLSNPTFWDGPSINCDGNSPYSWRHEMTDVFGQLECHAIAYCSSGRPYVYADSISTQCDY
ncbi:MAG: hypothetical protein R3A80_09420 [Bdellovibrionota bacterium]